jgi:hypothetical protein
MTSRDGMVGLGVSEVGLTECTPSSGGCEWDDDVHSTTVHVVHKLIIRVHGINCDTHIISSGQSVSAQLGS